MSRGVAVNCKKVSLPIIIFSRHYSKERNCGRNDLYMVTTHKDALSLLHSAVIQLCSRPPTLLIGRSPRHDRIGRAGASFVVHDCRASSTPEGRGLGFMCAVSGLLSPGCPDVHYPGPLLPHGLAVRQRGQKAGGSGQNSSCLPVDNNSL